MKSEDVICGILVKKSSEKSKIVGSRGVHINGNRWKCYREVRELEILKVISVINSSDYRNEFFSNY